MTAKALYLSLLAVVALAAQPRSSFEDIAASKPRASTPHREDRPISAASLKPLLAQYGSNLDEMWNQATRSDLLKEDPNSTDCRAYMLQYEFSLRLMPERAPLRDVFDSLQLYTNCGVTPPSASLSTAFFKPLSKMELSSKCTVDPIFVDAVSGDDSNLGSITSPVKTIARAVSVTRASRLLFSGSAITTCIVLRGGVHYLSDTISFTSADSGLIFSGHIDDSPAWVSGGTLLPSLQWTQYNPGSGNVWVADVSSFAITSIPGLQTVSTSGDVPPTRLFQAMYPNYDIEQFIGQLPGDREATWLKPGKFDIPTLYYKDLKALGLKDSSTMREYNIVSLGTGGVCQHWDNSPDEWAYVCSNQTAGGWEEIERGFATSGQLGFPIGLQWNQTLLPSFSKWTMPAADPSDWSNTPILTQWHNQGWYQASYAVTNIDQTKGVLNLTADGIWPSGGWQGGRTMENCNPDNLDPSEPLCAGPWYVRNVFEELDNPSEYFFDPINKKLYIYYNATAGTPPPADYDLVASKLEVFFNLTGTSSAPVTDIVFAGMGFRDQRPAQLDRWEDPSGGDWGIRRAGLLHFEGTERVNVSGSTFYRTDANSVMISGYNRNTTVEDCEFAYIGMNAVVTYGRCKQDDCTAGQQPWGTVLAYNKVHEIGAYQLQSSFWFISKAALTRSEGNVVFNIPRAAINFNDAMAGGGHNVTLNSIWNTCRQSGDHGPMNSWDRLPGLNLLASSGATASYNASLTETTHSMIIANYGASQSFDNDDGSSWYWTHDNFFYDASGFKMDYGGHSSLFSSNVIIASHGQNCLGTASFIAGYATQIFDNDCVVIGTRERVDDLFENCDGPNLAPNVPVRGYNNRFYTTKGNATVTCDCCGEITLAELAKIDPTIEQNYSTFTLPSSDQIISWGRQKLMLN